MAAWRRGLNTGPCGGLTTNPCDGLSTGPGGGSSNGPGGGFFAYVGTATGRIVAIGSAVALTILGAIVGDWAQVSSRAQWGGE
jgi:hypothetical protein